jgi:hypothetical protein
MSVGMSTRMSTEVDVADYEWIGYTAGLSAGLAKALADLDDTDLASAPSGYAAVPTRRVDAGATVVEHGMATSEGVAILDVRLPAGLVSLRHAGDRPEVVGLRLAAVRIGLARKVLDHAIVHLTGRPLIRAGLGVITETLSALDGLREYLDVAARRPSRPAVADLHAQLTRLDWQVAKLFGAGGYRAEHPVRALFVAELVANTWVGDTTRHREERHDG